MSIPGIQAVAVLDKGVVGVWEGGCHPSCCRDKGYKNLSQKLGLNTDKLKYTRINIIHHIL